jgi:hypothetical protein
LGVRVIAAPASGAVSIKLPGGDAFVPLGATTPVPVGATVDARRGSLTFQAAGGATATLAAGIFRIRQARAEGAPTDLVLATAQQPLTTLVVRTASTVGWSDRCSTTRRLGFRCPCRPPRRPDRARDDRCW